MSQGGVDSQAGAQAVAAPPFDPIYVIFAAVFLLLLLLAAFLLARRRNAAARREQAAAAAANRAPASFQSVSLRGHSFAGGLPLGDSAPNGSTALLHRAELAKRGGFCADHIPAVGSLVVYQVEGKDAEPVGQTECAVCLSSFLPKESLRKLHACDHIFHQECCDSWLLLQRSCPLCRRLLHCDTKEVDHPCPAEAGDSAGAAGP